MISKPKPPFAKSAVRRSSSERHLTPKKKFARYQLYSHAPLSWDAAPLDQRVVYATTSLVQTLQYPVNGAAGIVGNLWAESCVLPNRLEGSRSATPMTALNFAREMVTFTAQEVMQRDRRREVGPMFPGVGIAQWSSFARRKGFFEFSFRGRTLGPEMLNNLDAQILYLAAEIASKYRTLNNVLKDPEVSVETASDEFVYNFEIPASILDQVGRRRAKDHPKVRREFAKRRDFSQKRLEFTSDPSPFLQTYS